MVQLLDVVQIIIAILGAITGITSLYIHYKRYASQRPFLVAWVLSACYSFRSSKVNTYPDLDLELELLVQNKGRRNTTISNIFAEVKVGKKFPAIHGAEGKINTVASDGKTISGSVPMLADDSKNIYVAFRISNVDPKVVHRSESIKTPLHSSILQDPIIVNFLVRHTHGSLNGWWAIYDKNQKFYQLVHRFMSRQRVQEGKPNWVER